MDVFACSDLVFSLKCCPVRENVVLHCVLWGHINLYFYNFHQNVNAVHCMQRKTSSENVNGVSMYDDYFGFVIYE